MHLSQTSRSHPGRIEVLIDHANRTGWSPRMMGKVQSLSELFRPRTAYLRDTWPRGSSSSPGRPEPGSELGVICVVLGWGSKGRWFKSSRPDCGKPPQVRRFRCFRRVVVPGHGVQSGSNFSAACAKWGERASPRALAHSREAVAQRRRGPIPGVKSQAVLGQRAGEWLTTRRHLRPDSLRGFVRQPHAKAKERRLTATLRLPIGRRGS